MYLSLGTLRDISLFIISIIGAFGLLILYFKIWRIAYKIKKINNDIEDNKNELNKKELKTIKSDYDFGLDLKDNKKEKQEKRNIEHNIEKLERQKKYLLEEISIYKIFKK